MGSGNGEKRGSSAISESEILTAIANYVGLGSFDEARAVYDEAQESNKVAQFIVGVALVRRGFSVRGKNWIRLSAEAGFEPARQYLKKVG